MPPIPKNGFVYALTYQGKTKIGRSERNVERRIAALISQGGFDRSQCEIFFIESGNHQKVETDCHKLLNNKRVVGTEWFLISNGKAKSLILKFSIKKDNNNPQDQEKLANFFINMAMASFERKQHIEDIMQSNLKIAKSCGRCVFEKDGKFYEINPAGDIRQLDGNFLDIVIKENISWFHARIEYDEDHEYFDGYIFSLCFDGAEELSEKIGIVTKEVFDANRNLPDEEIYKLAKFRTEKLHESFVALLK